MVVNEDVELLYLPAAGLSLKSSFCAVVQSLPFVFKGIKTPPSAL